MPDPVMHIPDRLSAQIIHDMGHEIARLKAEDELWRIQLGAFKAENERLHAEIARLKAAVEWQKLSIAELTLMLDSGDHR